MTEVADLLDLNKSAVNSTRCNATIRMLEQCRAFRGDDWPPLRTDTSFGVAPSVTPPQDEEHGT